MEYEVMRRIDQLKKEHYELCMAISEDEINDIEVIEDRLEQIEDEIFELGRELDSLKESWNYKEMENF